MVSNIDPTKPTTSLAYTADVRANFAAAKSEIEMLQTSGGGSGGNVGVTKTDQSGIITLGGLSQLLMSANSARRGWSIQNKSVNNMWFNDLGFDANPSANNSTYLPPGAYYESENNGASISSISIVGDVTNSQFVAKEW